MKRRRLIYFSALIVLFITLVVINPGQIFTIVLLKMLGHYQPPQTETPQSLMDYTKENSVYYDKLYSVAGIHSLIDLNNKGISKVPTVQIFDEKKNLLVMAEENDCTWALTNYFKHHSEDMISKDSLIYPYVMERLRLIDEKVSNDSFDYYVISYWAKYLPKLSQRLFAQTNSMKESMSENICFMYVSLDQQEDWNME